VTSCRAKRWSPRMAAAVVGLVSAPAVALAQTETCQITNSPCYPWQIDAGDEMTVVLDIKPNNAVTSATYRICICQPQGPVSVVYKYDGQEVELGRVARAGANTRCRDFRIETSRQSQLVLKRLPGREGAQTGCYTSMPNLP